MEFERRVRGLDRGVLYAELVRSRQGGETLVVPSVVWAMVGLEMAVWGGERGSPGGAEEEERLEGLKSCGWVMWSSGSREDEEGEQGYNAVEPQTACHLLSRRVECESGGEVGGCWIALVYDVNSLIRSSFVGLMRWMGERMATRRPRRCACGVRLDPFTPSFLLWLSLPILNVEFW